MLDLKTRLQRSASAVYLATEEEVAKDISSLLLEASDEIEILESIIKDIASNIQKWEEKR